MIDTLATLIKLSAQKVEKVQQKLATAQRQLAEVNLTQQRWKTDLARANQAGMDSIAHNESDALRQAELFGRRVDNELMVLAKLEAAINGNIAKIRATLNDLFAEQKRYEILHQQKLLAERRKHAKKGQAALDEVAGQKRRLS